MKELYGVLLSDGSWWLDTNLDPMCGSKDTIRRKLISDRLIPEFAHKLVGARVVSVTRSVVLHKLLDRRLP